MTGCSKGVVGLLFISMHLMLISLPPIYGCVPCTHPNPPSHAPPSSGSGHPPTRPHPSLPHPPTTTPPHHGGGSGGGGKGKGGGGGKGKDKGKGKGKGHRHPPSKGGRGTPTPTLPPRIVLPPPIILNPPPVIVNPPPVIVTPPPVPILNPPPPPTPPSPLQPTCPVGGLKIGACVDVLGGLVHVGVGDPVENVCCPVLKGLLEIEAAVCLCASIRIKLLNINIFIPLALQALITCGKTPPPGFICPPLL